MRRKRVTEIEQETFTPLIFTTIRGMGKECVIYSNKKKEVYSKTMAWIRAIKYLF